MSFRPSGFSAAICTVALLFAVTVPAQEVSGDEVDLRELNAIKDEAFQHSKVMDNLFYISEVYGPRVNNSRNHHAAEKWAMKQMKDWDCRMFTWRSGARSATAGRSRSSTVRWTHPLTPR